VAQMLARAGNIFFSYRFKDKETVGFLVPRYQCLDSDQQLRSDVLEFSKEKLLISST
jgi:hypothetical protein